jgi:threonine dehydratase
VDYVFVSVGGGGLISGLAFYFHYIKNEQTKIIGVQPQGNSCMWNSIQRKGIDSETTLVPTLSDATDGGIEDGSITYDICSRLVDEWVIVSESELVNGLRELAQTEKLIVEGSAGLAYAGAMKYLSQNPVHCSP